MRIVRDMFLDSDGFLRKSLCLELYEKKLSVVFNFCLDSSIFILSSWSVFEVCVLMLS